jgi:hypothetical protein
VGPRADMDDVENLKIFYPPGLELRRVRSKSLYRLSYRGLSKLFRTSYILAKFYADVTCLCSKVATF